jgi:hypothetical protein
MSMICDHAAKCGDKASGCCVISRPHVCKDCHPEDGGLTFCYIAERYVRCIPHRDYDAEGRAARLECIRQILRIRRDRRDYPSMAIRVSNMALTYQGVMMATKSILRAMREARKEAK